jgi:hypothetical protein
MGRGECPKPLSRPFSSQTINSILNRLKDDLLHSPTLLFYINTVILAITIRASEYSYRPLYKQPGALLGNVMRLHFASANYTFHLIPLIHSSPCQEIRVFPDTPGHTRGPSLFSSGVKPSGGIRVRSVDWRSSPMGFSENHGGPC